jgi:predicted transcriptional regulator YheO
MKRNTAQVGGRNLWDWEIELLTQLDMPLHDARRDIISLWMGMGDLRPLADAITEGYASKQMLKHLAHLIRNGAQLTVKRGRGKPKQATKAARDRILWLLYENGVFDSKRSDDAFREIAAKFSVSEQTVRQAVTKLRKPPPKIAALR